MKFLVDQNLSPQLAELLAAAGHDAVHTRDIGAARASDSEIVQLAAGQGRVIVSADTDFGALLAQNRATQPSVILVRDILELRAPQLANVLLKQLDTVASYLAAGAIVVLTRKAVRVRELPLR